MIKYISNIILLSIFFLFSLSLSAQTQIQGTVKNVATNKPIAFCSIAIKGTAQGTITNADGAFTISADTEKDVFIFSFLGYKTKIISAKSFLKNNIVYLQKSSFTLSKVVVHANNDFLYDILNKCRKKIPKYNPKNVAKTYLGLETVSKQRPVEMLEIYYNGHLNGTNIDKLMIKNGRVAWDTVGNNYFASLATSKALSRINLTDKNYNFPAIPLQYKERKMKKYFKLKIITANDHYYQIAFSPRQDSARYFSGNIWVDKQYNLLKINLKGENIRLYPFIPIFPKDSIYNFSINITETFKPIQGTFLPNYIHFKYRFTYKSFIDSSVNSRRDSIITNTYTTKGILYFYDYNKPFILPYFDYDPNYDDYRKLSFIPYDSVFWNHNNKLILTKKQKQDLGFFAKKGYLLKYNRSYPLAKNTTDSSLINPRTIFFENYNIIWSKTHRLTIAKSISHNREKPPHSAVAASQNIPSDLYNFKVQILLNIARVGDSLYHSSYTVFDRYSSFYHLPRYPYTDCFLNIYFDICEIERRKMEQQLPKVAYNLNKMNSIYNQTKAEMQKITQRYLREVFLGKNTAELKKWSIYVNIHLGIDNFKMYKKQIHNK